MGAHKAAWRLQFAWRLSGIAAGRPLVGPLRVSLEIAHLCNLSCSFCEAHGSLQATPITARRRYVGGRQTMSVDTVASLCGSLARMHVRRVELSGKGEPMAHPELAAVVRNIKQAGLICSLVTNGTLAEPDLAATLVELRLDRLNVSLNAASREVYARIAGEDLWERAFGFVRDVLVRRRAGGARYPWARVSYVLCRDNVADGEGMVDLCCKLRLDEINWVVMGELPETLRLRLDAKQVSRLLSAFPGWSRRLEAAGVRHNLSRLASELRLRVGTSPQQENPLQRKLPCYDGWMFAVIGPDGTVTPCCPCENVRLGNINEEGFREVWNGPRYQEFRRRALTMPRTGKPVCWECFTSCNRAADNERIHRWLGALHLH